jgi:hypothetical protein
VYAADPFLSAERITSFVDDVSLVRLELQQVTGLAERIAAGESTGQSAQSLSQPTGLLARLDEEN